MIGGGAYWFYLEPYVYTSIKKGDHVLLYNTHNGDFLEYSNQPDVSRLVKRITARENLYVAKITEAMLAKPVVAAFVQEVRDRFMGDLLDARYFPQKPVQMMPFLNIEKDAEKFKKDAPHRLGEDLMTYVCELSLYLTNQCRLDCDGCETAFLQFPHCTRRGDSRVSHMPISTIKNILQETAGTSLFRLNFLGGDIFLYPYLKELIEYLRDVKAFKSFFVHYENIPDSHPEFQAFCQLGEALEVNVLVNFPVNNILLKRSLEYLSMKGVETTFFFPVKNEQEAETAEEIDLGSTFHNKRLLPYFDGNNLDFFERNVYLSKEIILGVKPSLQDIFARQAINGNNFGKLTVFPDGRIYSNVNLPRLGNIKRNSLYEAVYKEMLHGRGWRLARCRVNPCNRCIFESLCPPLSNYELVIGRNNLCDVWND